MTRVGSAEAAASASVPPRVPERYEGLEILGQGAMGVVYKAHDRDLDRTVAIKTIHPSSVARSDFEAIAARLCRDRKSTRLNSSHLGISYAVFCLKKKKNN